MQTLLDYTQPLIHLFVRTNSFPIFLNISVEISCTKNCCFRPTPTLPVPVHSMTIESVYGAAVLPFERNSFIQGYISWTLLPAESSFGKLSAASFSKPGVTSWIEPNSFPVAFLPWQHCLLALSIIRCPRTVAVMSKTDVFRNEIASELSVFFFSLTFTSKQILIQYSVNETGPRSRACGRMNILQTGWSSDDLWKTRHISVVFYWFHQFVEIVCWTQTLAMEWESWGNFKMNKSTFEKMALSRHRE